MGPSGTFAGDRSLWRGTSGTAFGLGNEDERNLEPEAEPGPGGG